MGEMIAKPKIDYFYAANLAVFIQDNHYVFGLDVAVHDVEGVQLPQADYQLLCDFGCIVFLFPPREAFEEEANFLNFV